MPDPCSPFSDNLLFGIGNVVGDAQKALKVAQNFGQMASTVMEKVAADLENPAGMLSDLVDSLTPTAPPLPSIFDIIDCPAARCLIPGAEVLAGMPAAAAEALAAQLLADFSAAQRTAINAAVEKNIGNMMQTPLGMLASMQKGLNFAMKGLGVGSQVTGAFSSIIDCMTLHNPAMVAQMEAAGALDNFNAVVGLGDPSAAPGLESTISSAQGQFDSMISQHVSDVSDFLP